MSVPPAAQGQPSSRCVSPSVWQYTAIGAALIPAQLAAATLGLHLTGALR